MKTETQIAQENIIQMKLKRRTDKMIQAKINKEHKSSCERFLEFLKRLSLKCVSNHIVVEIIDREIEDKEQAIKLYSENRI